MAGAKSELNLQQLKHFHALLRKQEIAFPRTETFKISPRSMPPDTPRYSRLCQALLELLDLHQGCGSHTGPDLEIF